MNTRYFQVFEQVTAIRRTERGLEADLGPLPGETLRVEILRADVVRLSISRNRRFDEKPTFAVCADLSAPCRDFTFEEDADLARIVTSRLTVTVHKAPFRVEAHRADGSAIAEPCRDAEGRWRSYGTLNDEFVVRRRCRREDAFYGLGQKTGRFNRRERNFTLWNTDVLNPNVTGGLPEHSTTDPARDPRSTQFDPYYISIPFFYHLPHRSDAMAGSFFDNGYRGSFEFTAPDEYLVHFRGGQYTEYLFAGPAMREILEAYTWLTGRMPPPPLWALGYHQCRWFAYTEAAVQQLAQTHRDRAIPCDALWLDIDHMDGYRVFTWDEERFPNHGKMLKKLRQRQFRVVTIIDPGVKCEPGYPVFDEGRRRGALCQTATGEIYRGQAWPGQTAFPDFVTPEARWWWGELNAEHIRSGIAGIWNDMNEPATGEIPPEAMRFDHGRQPHERFHNQYALLMAMSTVEGLLAVAPQERTFVLSRAGSAGIQRYAANWLGDNCSRWEHLWMSIPMSLGLGVSGQPFVGADIGGFIENATPELLVRWYQYGALTPFCRNHNCANQADQYPWVFGEAVEDLCRRALELRYRLMPYIYSQFMRAAETGAPIQRPLIFDCQHDRATREIDDQYLFGDHLLVAPVYSAGCTARQVYLPPGTWYQWHTGERFTGRKFVVAPAPMEYIPVYARGGAVIPAWPQPPQSTMDYQPETLDLHVFVPDEDGETRSTLHEDDGRTFAFRNGAFYRTEFVLRREGARLTLTATVSGRGYEPFSRKALRLKFHGLTAGTVTIDGRPCQVTGSECQLENAATNFSLAASLS